MEINSDDKSSLLDFDEFCKAVQIGNIAKVQEFLKDGIETYKTSLPKWRKEASSLLKSLCSEDDIEIMEQNMYRGPGKGNFNVIEGRIKFNCKDQSKNLKYLGFEIDDRIFLSSLKEVPPGVFVR